MASFALRKVCRCCGWMGEALQGIAKYCKPSGYEVVGSMIMTLLERQVQFAISLQLQSWFCQMVYKTFRCAAVCVPSELHLDGFGSLKIVHFAVARCCKHIPWLKEFVFAGLSALFGSMSFNINLSKFSISLSGTPSVSKHTPGTPLRNFDSLCSIVWLKNPAFSFHSPWSCMIPWLHLAEITPARGSKQCSVGG